MGTLTRLPLAGGVPALAAAVGFVVIAVFQIALAAGAPFGRTSWGGVHAGQLPTGMRVASAVAVGVWALAALIVLGRAGFAVSPCRPADWLGGLAVRRQADGTTVLAGPVVDQAGLHGVIIRIDLGLPLLSVQRTGPDSEQP